MMINIEVNSKDLTSFCCKATKNQILLFLWEQLEYLASDKNVSYNNENSGDSHEFNIPYLD